MKAPYYAKIVFDWLGARSESTHMVRIAYAQTEEEAREAAWEEIDEYMQNYPEGGYKASFTICKGVF